MTNFNIKQIMVEAWKIYHENSDSTCKAIFGECLRMAWANAKNTPEEVLRQWYDMEDTDKYNFVIRCVKRAAKDGIGYSKGNGGSDWEYQVAYILQFHGLDGIVNTAFEKLLPKLNAKYLEDLNARRAAKGNTNITLVSLVYHAAANAIQCLYRQEMQHVRGRVHTVTDKDGNESQYIDEAARPMRDNVEVSALKRIAFTDFYNGRDEVDRAIIDAKVMGISGKDIAAMLGITAAAVSKRMKKLRAAGVEAGLCREEASA